MSKTLVWKEVVEYEGLYEVSNSGDIRSVERMVNHPKGGMALKKGKLLSACPNKDGYLRVPLWRDCKSKYKYVSRLVLEAFVGPRPANMESCHGDNDRANNFLSNLRWDTHVSNIADKNRHGTYQRGERGNGAKLTDVTALDIKLRAIAGESGVSLAAEFGVTPTTITRVKLGQTWSHIHV